MVVATTNSVICGLAIFDALATGIRHARWNLTAKAAASVCVRMIIGVATRLPVPAGFKPIAGDWPPYDDNCRGFIWNPSGHVIGLLLASWELNYRRAPKFWVNGVHAVNFVQAVRLVSLQQHYTVDVITALGVAYFVDQVIEQYLSASARVQRMSHRRESNANLNSKPRKLRFQIQPSGVTATATLLWDEAPLHAALL